MNRRPARWRVFGARMAASLLAGLAALVLASCGGGGVGEGGTGGSFASGPITGFGSVIVNDIVFDDSAAEVEDGEGGRFGRLDLRLGMMVEIEGEALQQGSSGRTARATRVRFDSALVGPVEAIDAAGGSFTVLGQRVEVSAATVFDTLLAGGLGALRADDVVEVYGYYDPSVPRVRATRVELRERAGLVVSRVLVYRVRGIVDQVDAAALVPTLRIGNGLFAYGSAIGTPAGLAAGQFVRLTLARTPGPLGRWLVVSFGTGLREVLERDGVVLKGQVTRYTSAADFDIDGRRVDAAGVAVSGGVLAFGVRAEATGVLRAGILRASAVEVRTDNAESDHPFDVRGAIESINGTQATFVVRGITVNTSRSDLVYDGRGSSSADLAVGRQVRVRGFVAGSGTSLDATRITFE